MKKDLRRTIILNERNSKWFDVEGGTLNSDKLMLTSDDNNKAETCYNCAHCERSGDKFGLCKSTDHDCEIGSVIPAPYVSWCPHYTAELSWVMSSIGKTPDRHQSPTPNPQETTKGDQEE